MTDDLNLDDRTLWEGFGANRISVMRVLPGYLVLQVNGATAELTIDQADELADLIRATIAQPVS